MIFVKVVFEILLALVSWLFIYAGKLEWNKHRWGSILFFVTAGLILVLIYLVSTL